MYTAIKTYCENVNSNGLFLIDMPTGFGKTFSVLKYICDACQQEENNKRRYFFITPFNKNLPINELKQHLILIILIQKNTENLILLFRMVWELI